MSRWKYLLVIVSLVSWLAGLLLAYVSSYADRPSLYVGLWCWLALIAFALAALLRRRWHELAIFTSTLAVIFHPGLGVPQPAHWFRVIGFRLYASPLESYLSRCKLFDFIDDDGSRQQVGQCYSFALTPESWFTVIYDTTGQFALPVERRTRAWQSNISWHLSAGAFLSHSDHDESHIFGNFYAISTTLDEEDGNDAK